MSKKDINKNLSNRQRQIAIHSKSKFWCPKCDASRIGLVGRCKVCGHKEFKHNGKTRKQK